MKHTAIPHTGPRANDVIRPGSSEKSSLMNDGMIGMLKSRNISTIAIADITAVTAIFLTELFFFIEISPLKY